MTFEVCEMCGCPEWYAPMSASHHCVCECHTAAIEETSILGVIIAAAITIFILVIMLAELHVL